MHAVVVKRFARVWMLGALAALAGCDNGDDDPPPPPPVPTANITASPATVQLGSASTVTWSSSNATTCVASGSWTGVKTTSGSESVQPSAVGNATYTLICTGAGGSAAAAATVAVTAPPTPPTATLTPGASTVLVGSSTTLTWSSTDATGCTAGGAWSGTRPASGNETVTLAALGVATYTLTCTGAGGNIVASATVTAIAAVDFLLTSNDNGNVSVYRLDAATGAPSDTGGGPSLAGGSPRAIVFGADNRVAYIGNNTDISAFRVDPVTGALTPVTGSPFANGGGPQAMAIHPAGTFLYTASGDGLHTHAVNPTSGALTSVGTVVPGSYGVALHPSGNFAYAVSGGVGGVYVYAIGGNGALTAIAGSPFGVGIGGIEVAIDPTGQFAYVARAIFDSPGTVSAFSINATTGALTPVGSPLAIATGPAMLAIDPQGAFLYVACNGGPTNFGALLGYSINRSTGALTPLPGSPFSPSDHYSMAFAINRSGTYAYETRWRAGSTSELRTLSIGTTGALTEVPGSRLALGPGWVNGIAVTR